MGRPNFLKVYDVRTQCKRLVNLNNVFEIRMETCDDECGDDTHKVVAESYAMCVDPQGNTYTAETTLFSGELAACDDYIEWIMTNYDVVRRPTEVQDATQGDPYLSPFILEALRDAAAEEDYSISYNLLRAKLNWPNADPFQDALNHLFEKGEITRTVVKEGAVQDTEWGLPTAPAPSEPPREAPVKDRILTELSRANAFGEVTLGYDELRERVNPSSPTAFHRDLRQLLQEAAVIRKEGGAHTDSQWYLPAEN